MSRAATRGMSEADRSTELAVERTELALERTTMASERTLMAWGRTGLAQISLGLALYKFIVAIKAPSGRRLALVVLVLGMLSTVIGVADYLSTTRRLRRDHGYDVRRSRYHLALAVMIALFGVGTFATLLVGMLD